MRIEEMSRADFKKLPHRKWDDVIHCKSIVLLPLKKKHSSGYRLMDFIAVDRYGIPLCACSGCSDVLHINGIGGYELSKRFYKNLLNPSIRMDCLGKSGLYRIFMSDPNANFVIDAALSDFVVYCVPEGQNLEVNDEQI